MITQICLVNNTTPKIMKKLPKYKGCLRREYIPVVFNLSATWLLVFLPEVPEGVWPIVSTLIAMPQPLIEKQITSIIVSYFMNWLFFKSRIAPIPRINIKSGR